MIQFCGLEDCLCCDGCAVWPPELTFADGVLIFAFCSDAVLVKFKYSHHFAQVYVDLASDVLCLLLGS